MDYFNDAKETRKCVYVTRDAPIVIQMDLNTKFNQSRSCVKCMLKWPY